MCALHVNVGLVSESLLLGLLGSDIFHELLTLSLDGCVGLLLDLGSSSLF